MNALALTLLIGAVVAVLVAPRRWAPVVLLSAACYVPTAQGIELGGVSLPVYRVMLALGLVRTLVRREQLVGGFNSIDLLMIAWAGWVLLASFFHLTEPGSGPVFAAGYVMNVAMSYFLFRVWCRGLDDAIHLLKAISVLVIPIAAGMLAEQVLLFNVFSVFGGIPEWVSVRDGSIRSQGPFQHAILAGTVGSVCLAYMAALWKEHRGFAVIGAAACISMVLASGSSGPLMSLIMTVGAVMAWKWREWMRVFRYGLVVMYLLLELVMPAPAYYVISKFDLTGSSTGWHRSRLIEMAIEHFPEWWLFGTDYTVHWMGLTNWSERHSDITNYYLSIGVVAGFPALVLVILMLWRAFAWVGSLVRNGPYATKTDRFAIWCLGAGIFAHAVSSLSVSYFDQSVVFFWLNIAIVSALYSSARASAQPEEAPASMESTPASEVAGLSSSLGRS